MRKNFNAQRYNQRMEKIFATARGLIKKYERVNALKEKNQFFNRLGN